MRVKAYWYVTIGRSSAIKKTIDMGGINDLRFNSISAKACNFCERYHKKQAKNTCAYLSGFLFFPYIELYR